MIQQNDYIYSVLNKMKNKDATTLMGDFNMKIGSINRGFEEVHVHVMGQQRLGIINENGN